MKWFPKKFFARYNRPTLTVAAATLMLGAPTALAQSNQQGNNQSQQQQDRDRQRGDRDQQDQRDQRDRDRNSQDAQNRDQRRSDTQRSNRDQAQQRRNQRRPQRGERRQQRPRRQQAGYRLNPEGWVRIAADYDNDGRYDAFETVYVFDLEQARQRSRQRRGRDMGGRPMAQRETRGYRSGDRSRSSNPRSGSMGLENASLQNVRGEVNELKSVQLAGMDQSNRIAQVSTDDGKKMVVRLGTQQELRKLNLQKGDQIEVKGVKARLNDREILMATNIRHDGQSVSVDLPQKTNLKRVKAEIMSTREVKFRNFNQPFVVGQVETLSGKQELVNFGPASKFEELDVQKGDQVKLLVRKGRINRQDALIAQEIEASGNRVEISRVEDRRRFRRNQDRR